MSEGIPLRIEIGPRDIAENKVTIARRIIGGKEPIGLDAVTAYCQDALDLDHPALYDEALRHRDELTADVTTIDEARDAAQTGFARIPWANLGVEGEKKLAEAAITVRCLVRPDGEIPTTDDEDGAIAHRYPHGRRPSERSSPWRRRRTRTLVTSYEGVRPAASPCRCAGVDEHGARVFVPLHSGLPAPMLRRLR